MEVRVENPEIKPQIESFVIETLENCKLFVDTYGKGFAEKRLAENFKTVYTDELNKKARGQYSLGTSGVMTLFMMGKKGSLLTFDDIKEKEDLQTVLHESVHAIFNKTPEECFESGIRLGSGIHELYQDYELGRGLNEGFTNWVCDKAGFKTMSYPTLTNLVNILEMAIGPEKLMRFGEGGIASNISNLLGMHPMDCQTFISKADQIYYHEDKATDFDNLASVLRRKSVFESEKAKNPQLTMDEALKNDLQALQNNFEYTNILKNIFYMDFAQKNNLKPELEASKLEFFENEKKTYRSRAKTVEQEIKGKILSKYFMEELKGIVESNSPSVEQYKKFSKLSSLLSLNDELEDENMKSFKETFSAFRKQFYDKVEFDIKDSLKSGTLTPEKILQYKDATYSGNPFDPNDFNTIFSKIMLPENPYIYENLFRVLNSHNMIPEIFNYKIFELETQNGFKTNLFYNKKSNNHFARYISDSKTFTADSVIEDKDSLFDMTLDGLQSMQEIVNNFLELKEKISQTSPNTKLQIVENVVVSTKEGENPEFYVLEGNNWNLAKVNEYLPQNIQQETTKDSLLEVESIDTSNIQKENNNNFLAIISNNPFKKFFQNLKRRFFKPEPQVVLADTQPSNLENKMEEMSKTFNDSLSHTQDGKKIETPTITDSSNQKKSESKDIEHDF